MGEGGNELMGDDIKLDQLHLDKNVRLIYDFQLYFTLKTFSSSNSFYCWSTYHTWHILEQQILHGMHAFSNALFCYHAKFNHSLLFNFYIVCTTWQLLLSIFYWALKLFIVIEGVWNTSLLIFKILPLLMKYRILLMGNTVEMAGGWHLYLNRTLFMNEMF